MRIRSLASALAVGGLVLTGGLAADPGEESENGCRGVNEADEHNDDAAQDALEQVKSIIDPDDRCNDDERASEAKGGNGQGDEG